MKTICPHSGLAQINEDDYFGHVVHQDIDSFIRDIRDAHRKDALTTDVKTPAIEAQKQWKEP